MRKITYYCDLCGIEMKDDNRYLDVTLAGYYSLQKKHLCYFCVSEFCKILNKFIKIREGDKLCQQPKRK